MNLNIDYFAILREQAGKRHELFVTDAATPEQVYAILAEQYGFDLSQSRLRVAVNERFVDWSCHLNDGDRLVFIPPVAGG